MVKLKRQRKSNFTVIDNTVLQDTELTFKAKGLFAYLWSQSDEWNFYETEVVKHSKDGISSLRSGIHELEERGYLQRKRIRVKGKLKDSMWILSETPNLENLSLENLNLENSTLINTNSNNTNLNKDNRSTDKSVDRVSEKQLDEDFNKLWKLYPRKEGKKKAFEAYKRAIKKGTTNKEIQTGIVNYLTQIKVQGTAKQYIKQGSTWFNGECWDDDYNLGESQVPVNPKEKTGDAPRPRSREEEELEARKQSAEAFLYNLREHPEYFEIEHMKAAINDFVAKNPELKEEVLEIARTRGKSDRNTA